MLAALEPNCSCALLPLCYIIFNGHGIRSASSQVNSKTFPIPPVSVQVIVLPLPRLIVCCGCIRCFWLRVPLKEGLSYPKQCLGIWLWDARWDSNPRPRRMGNLLFYQLNYLRQRTTTKQYRILWWVEVVSFKKTSTEMILINNELDIFL